MIDATRDLSKSVGVALPRLGGMAPAQWWACAPVIDRGATSRVSRERSRHRKGRRGRGGGDGRHLCQLLSGYYMLHDPTGRHAYLHTEYLTTPFYFLQLRVGVFQPQDASHLTLPRGDCPSSDQSRPSPPRCDTPTHMAYHLPHTTRYTQKWNHTLGYIGEGPSIKILSLNIRSLSDNA